MKRFVSLIVLICLIIDDKILAMPISDDGEVDNWSTLHKVLESLAHEGMENIKVSKSSLDGSIRNSYTILEKEENTYVFQKKNTRLESNVTYHGEFEGLKAIRSTKTVLAPRPLYIGYTKYNQFLLEIEFLNVTKLDALTSAELGSQLADMHLHNLQHICRKQPAVMKFGFHVPTSVGFTAQNNTWTDNWITFFTENRLAYQIQLLKSKSELTAEKKEVIKNYWPRLKSVIPKFFEGIDVKPSLLHGDLWSENAFRCGSKPVVLDPAAFYGHHEYDIAAAIFFNDFLKTFYDAYFKKIPKAVGFEKRMPLYTLFYALNDWNQYGNGNATIKYFKELLNIHG